MVCGALSCFRFCSSDWCLVLGSRRAIRISGGAPGFRTPDHIVDAMKRAIEEGHTHYGEFAHTRELREAIAEKYRGLGVDVDPDRVLVTPGRARGLSSVDVAMYLREEGNVVVTPGSLFGSRGEGHIRQAYAQSWEDIREGLGRIGEVLARL